MHRLLVIKPSSLGDIVHGLQLLQAVSRGRPDLHITWVVRERFAGLVQAAPFIHQTIIFRRRDGLRGFGKLVRELRAQTFDAVWDLQGLLRSGVMTAVVRAPVKWGRPDAREGAGFFYDRRVSRPSGTPPHHALDILWPFAQTLGVGAELAPLELRPAPVFSWSGFFAGDPGRTFVIFTDSRGPAKTWPHFQALMSLILERIPGSRVAWCAGHAALPKFSATPNRFLNLTGCPLDEMIALVRQPSIFIGNDSGPMHLAAASHNRVLALFGPTSPRRFGPYPLESPRHRAIVAPDGNLARLSPEVVLESLQIRSGEAIA